MKDTFYVESEYCPENFDHDIKQVLDFINTTFSVETKIEINIGKWFRPVSYLDSKTQPVMTTIVKKEGSEATVSSPLAWHTQRF